MAVRGTLSPALAVRSAEVDRVETTLLSTRMSPPLSTVSFARRRDCLVTVKSWFISEWPAWYGPSGPGNIDHDLQAFAASENVLPVGVLVLEGSEVVGAGALKADSIPSHSHLGPWAAAGYVIPSHRGRGVGAFLLQGLVARARELGFQYIYCGTSTANALLARSGWSLIETTELQGKPLGVYRSTA